VNYIISNLPFEFHLPGYIFYARGTQFDEWFARGERGINRPHQACREHDIDKKNFKNIDARHIADKD